MTARRGARLALALAGLALAACGVPASGPAETPTLAATASPAPPSPTPIPHLLWIGGPDEGMQAALSAWAEARGWALSLDLAEVSAPGVQAVVAQDAQVAAGMPSALPLVVVDGAAAVPGERRSVIGGEGDRWDQAAFLAGALAGLASRTGNIGLVEGVDQGLEAVESAAFLHGLRYGCARCTLVRRTAAEASPAALLANAVDVVYAVGDERSAAALAPLAQAGLWVVWTGTPPEGVAPERLAGGVGFAPQGLVLLALEALLEGEPGRRWPYAAQGGGLQLVAVDPAAISPGRLRVLEETLLALASGELHTGVDPHSGAPE